MKNRSILILLAAILITVSCKSWRNTEKGAVIGAGTGGAVGAVIGKQTGNTVVGAIIGAAVGGTAGALIGNYMDKQADEIKRDLEGAKVERIGEGIKITFDSGLLFAFDSYNLNETSRANLDKLSEILKKYDDTNILIEGHTDNVGSDDYNKKLSDNRADEVADYLKNDGVMSSRITSTGYGESQPVMDNATEEGRANNRRVDIAIFANKKLKKAAENGTIGSLD
jgi:outer membrane protein OmpA-like peptidoglycan-associated protein